MKYETKFKITKNWCYKNIWELQNDETIKQWSKLQKLIIRNKSWYYKKNDITKTDWYYKNIETTKQYSKLQKIEIIQNNNCKISQNYIVINYKKWWYHTKVQSK